METLYLVMKFVGVIVLVGGFFATMNHRWQSKFSQGMLAKSFFWFGMACAVLAFFIQNSDPLQTGSQGQFAGPIFFLLLGILSMLGGVYVNTEKK